MLHITASGKGMYGTVQKFASCGHKQNAIDEGEDSF